MDCSIRFFLKREGITTNLSATIEILCNIRVLFITSAFKQTMGRILAIDYGRKKTGIAVTDTLKIAAHGLETQQTIKLFDFLAKYLAQEDVDLIIVGLPRHPDGNLSSNADEIKKFVDKIKTSFPEIEVELVDESYTSRDAKEVILKSGAGRKKRRDKELVDKVAAVLILQRYLNHI